MSHRHFDLVHGGIDAGATGIIDVRTGAVLADPWALRTAGQPTIWQMMLYSDAELGRVIEAVDYYFGRKAALRTQ